jgi:hypothetical protein
MMHGVSASSPLGMFLDEIAALRCAKQDHSRLCL